MLVYGLHSWSYVRSSVCISFLSNSQYSYLPLVPSPLTQDYGNINNFQSTQTITTNAHPTEQAIRLQICKRSFWQNKKRDDATHVGNTYYTHIYRLVNHRRRTNQMHGITEPYNIQRLVLFKNHHIPEDTRVNVNTVVAYKTKADRIRKHQNDEYYRL